MGNWDRFPVSWPNFYPPLSVQCTIQNNIISLACASTGSFNRPKAYIGGKKMGNFWSDVASVDWMNIWHVLQKRYSCSVFPPSGHPIFSFSLTFCWFLRSVAVEAVQEDKAEGILRKALSAGNHVCKKGKVNVNNWWTVNPTRKACLISKATVLLKRTRNLILA